MSRRLLLRSECRTTERRTPLIPADAGTLIDQGVAVLVERSAQRCFADELYDQAGCSLVPTGWWVEADPDVVVLGIKELPDEPAALHGRHIMFGHAFKGQDGAGELLGRFRRGGGTLLDLEYLTDEQGRRLVAFGYWAGFVGATLGVLQRAGELRSPLTPTDRPALESALRSAGRSLGGQAALVIGALGRVGRGACDALELAGLPITRWDLADTEELDRAAVLAHEILVNAVLATAPMESFVRVEDAQDAARELRVIADVTCDVTSALNVLPVNDRLTTWADPVRRITEQPVPLDVIAIDNLPSLVPREASEDFSATLVRLLPGLWDADPSWRRTADRFSAAVAAL